MLCFSAVLLHAGTSLTFTRCSTGTIPYLISTLHWTLTDLPYPTTGKAPLNKPNYRCDLDPCIHVHTHVCCCMRKPCMRVPSAEPFVCMEAPMCPCFHVMCPCHMPLPRCHSPLQAQASLRASMHHSHVSYPYMCVCVCHRGMGNHDFGNNIDDCTYKCGAGICWGLGALDKFGCAARAIRDLQWGNMKVWRTGMPCFHTHTHTHTHTHARTHARTHATQRSRHVTRPPCLCAHASKGRPTGMQYARAQLPVYPWTLGLSMPCSGSC